MFDREIREARFFNPLKGFKADVQRIEYRTDPLLQGLCRINLNRAMRVKQGQKDEDYSDLIQGSAEGCYFCPGNLKGDTPKFPRDIAEEGRLWRGESTVFPNLYPFAKHHAIATVTEKHFLPLEEFTREQIKNALAAGVEYFSRVFSSDDSARYMTLSWNHLPPSGASIIHPHIQLIADDKPTYLVGAYLEASHSYYRKHQSIYWLKLVREEEKIGSRFIGRTRGIAWLASFAPLGNNEVVAVFEDAQSLTGLAEKDISSFSEGLTRVLRGYHALGVKSFNMSTYSAPAGEEPEHFRLSARIVSRPAPRRFYTSDAGFMEALHHERIVESLPEDLAKSMKKAF